MASKELEKLPRGKEEIRDTLMETTTDDAGRFRFHEVPAPAFPEFPDAGQSIFPWDVVALKDGHALAWTQLTPHRERTPITMTLGPEGILRGRVVEPGGKPVVGARVKVLGIDPLGKGRTTTTQDAKRAESSLVGDSARGDNRLRRPVQPRRPITR